MASLQARHQPSCAIVRARVEAKAARDETGRVNMQTTFAQATKAAGCTCAPAYWIVHGGGKNPEKLGKNRKEDERALKVIDGQNATGTYSVPESKRFDAWAAEWLDRYTGKESSRENYAVTLRYAREAFGARKVRDVRPADVSRFLEHVRDENKRRTPEGRDPHEVSAATLAKHLRQLGACFAAAIAEGYAEKNPVRSLPDSVRPRPEDPEPDYFEDAELARLWPELAERPVYLALCKTAVTTGLRIGELAALKWSDVDLLERKLRVTKAYRNGRVTAPKSKRSRRTVNLTRAAAGVLEAWNRECGGADAAGLVFEREEGGHVQNEHVLRRVLYPAMQRAGVPRVGERGGVRSFHSFRDTFARIALEAGQPLQWVSRQLGHSSTAVTDRHYAEWARQAEAEQADKLPAEAFPV